VLGLCVPALFNHKAFRLRLGHPVHVCRYTANLGALNLSDGQSRRVRA